MDGWKEGVLEDFDSPMIPAPARVMIPQYPPMIGSSSQLSSPPLFSSPRRPLFIHLSLPPPSFLILLARRTPLYHPLHVQPSSDDVSFPRSFFARPKSSGYHVPLSLLFSSYTYIRCKSVVDLEKEKLIERKLLKSEADTRNVRAVFIG